MSVVLEPVVFIEFGGTIHADRYGAEPPKRATFDTNARHAPLDMAKTVAANQQRKLIAVHLFMKDSNDVTEEHIQKLAELIISREENRFIVTFGTDEVVKWGKHLKELLTKSGVIEEKTVFFLTAMLPMANGQQSDAPQNIVYAFSEIDKRRGVHIVGKMANRQPGCADVDAVKKNYKKRVFEPLERARGR